MSEIDYAKIELLVLDVDGVLTDGRVTLTPAGDEIKSFHVRDGAGMKYWGRLGRKLAIISGRGSPAVGLRARELGVEVVRLNEKNKLPAYQDVLEELGLLPAQAAVIGDDLTDLPMMRHCALSAAPADAVDEVREAADYITEKSGGQGAVREVIEMILRQAGLWQTILQRYIPESDE